MIVHMHPKRDITFQRLTNRDAVLKALDLFRLPEIASSIFLINSAEKSLFPSAWWRASNHQALYCFSLSSNALQTFKQKTQYLGPFLGI